MSTCRDFPLSSNIFCAEQSECITYRPSLFQRGCYRIENLCTLCAAWMLKLDREKACTYEQYVWREKQYREKWGYRGEKMVSMALTRKSGLMLFLSDSAQPSFLPKGEEIKERKEMRIDGLERLLEERMAVFSKWVSHRFCRAAPNITAPLLIEWW